MERSWKGHWISFLDFCMDHEYKWLCSVPGMPWWNTSKSYHPTAKQPYNSITFSVNWNDCVVWESMCLRLQTCSSFVEGLISLTFMKCWHVDWWWNNNIQTWKYRHETDLLQIKEVLIRPDASLLTPLSQHVFWSWFAFSGDIKFKQKIQMISIFVPI